MGEWGALTELKCRRHFHIGGSGDGLHERNKHCSGEVEEPSSAGAEICGATRRSVRAA